MAQKSSEDAMLESRGAGALRAREEFDRAVSPLRRELHAHCYRMLGSVHDADDAVQDGLLRAWRAYGSFEGRSSLRTWLYTIVTRTCLDVAAGRRRRALPIDLGPASAEPAVHAAPREDVPWLTPYPDPADSAERAESVELAFIAVLQHLSGNERAAFLLTDVLGFSAPEAAAAMSTTTTSIHSALARARRALSAREGAPDGLSRVRPSPSALSLAQQFADALAAADVKSFVALLAPDVTWEMPPLTEWYAGAGDVAAFAQAVPMTLCPSWRSTILTANGQPAVAFYVGEHRDGTHHAWSLTLLAVSDEHITGITSFLDPGLFPSFGLPSEITGAAWIPAPTGSAGSGMRRDVSEAPATIR